MNIKELVKNHKLVTIFSIIVFLIVLGLIFYKEYLALLFIFILFGGWLSILIIAFIIAFFVLSIKKKKGIYLIPIFIIVIIILYFSFVIQAPIKGKVIDAISGEPLQNVIVTHTMELHHAGFEGGWSDFFTQRKTTDQKGEFKFGWYTKWASGNFKSYVSVYICDNSTNLYYSPQCNKQLTDFYPDWEYREEAINSHINLIPSEINVFLMPLVSNINECKKAINEELVNECKIENALQLAIKNKDLNLCSLLKDERIINEDDCIVNVAIEIGDEKICNRLTSFLYESCIMGIASKLNDSEMCNKISNNLTFNRCVENVATNLRNIKICEKIKDIYEREYCENVVNKENGK